MSLLSSVAYIRTPEVTYRTQTATNGNTGNPHSSHRLIQKISSRGNAELPGNATQRTQQDFIVEKNNIKCMQ